MQRTLAPLSFLFFLYGCTRSADFKEKNPCTNPPDSCHTATGAVCCKGYCIYAPLCGIGECNQGICTSTTAQVGLQVVLISTPSFTSDRVFSNGRLTFQAILTNLTRNSLGLSNSAAAITVRDLKFGTTLVSPNIGKVDFLGGGGTDYEDPNSIVAVPAGGILDVAIVTLDSLKISASNEQIAYLTYQPVGSGDYTVRFEYHYGGSDVGVYKGTLSSSEVHFALP